VLISDLISEKNLLPDLVAKDRNSAYQTMVHFVVNKGFMNNELSSSSLEGLLAREAKMTTAMGGGFALPHATIPKLPKPCFLLARCPQGVDCEAVDGKPVTLFFLILTPPDHSQEHLQTLATVAKFFNRRGIKSKLLQASGGPEILSILRTP
jgi:mannitol/fructose-specific phosphotransferase system IIA component (Ntr-type)